MQDRILAEFEIFNLQEINGMEEVLNASGYHYSKKMIKGNSVARFVVTDNRCTCGDKTTESNPDLIRLDFVKKTAKRIMEDKDLYKFMCECCYKESMSENDIIMFMGSGLISLFKHTKGLADQLDNMIDTAKAYKGASDEMLNIVEYICHTPICKDMYLNFIEDEEEKTEYENKGMVNGANMMQNAHLVIDRTITSLLETVTEKDGEINGLKGEVKELTARLQKYIDKYGDLTDGE